MGSSILWQVFLQLALIALNAVFACAEIAVISVGDPRLAQLAEKGDKRAARLGRLSSQPARFLATIQVAITLSGFLGSAFAADNFASLLTDWLVGLGVGLSPETLDAIAIVVITMILSYVTLVFGELVPKRLAMKKAEALALGLSGVIGFISKVFAPIVSLLTVSTNGVLRLFGVDPNAEEESVSEDEIRMMVDVGSQKGVIDVQEKEIIQNVFEFDDLSVGEFATPRTDLTLLWQEDDEAEWEKTIQESRHSRYLVCGEDVDDVLGVLHVRDYFRAADKSRAALMKDVVKPAYFIPESMRADVLFRQMKRTRNHIAVVLDEYGGLVGVVTMNDLLEQLVGDLQDGTEAENAPQIERLDDDTWRVQGDTPLDDVSEALSVPLPVDEYDTFGGFVFGAYGSIPEDGSSFELDADRLHIRATQIAGHRLVKAEVRVAEAS